MANVKISQLPTAGVLTSTDSFPIVQGTATVKATMAGLDAMHDARYFRKGQNEAPGSELAYGQVTTGVITISATALPGDLIVESPVATYDGGPVIVEFSASRVTSTTAAGQLNLALFDGSVDLGRFGTLALAAGATVPILLKQRIAPAAGSHQFRVRGVATAGTATVVTGAGGPNGTMATYLRVTKV